MEHDSTDYAAFKARQLKARRKRLLAVAGVVVAVAIGWGALLASPNDDVTPTLTTPAPAASAATPQPSAAEPPPSTASGRPTRRAGATPQPSTASPAPAAPGDLAKELASDNAGVRIQALRAVRDGAAVEALPQLLALDPAKDPEAAPTLISSVVQLAKRAEPAQRTAAGEHLQAWLHGELARSGENTDARGNLSVLVEALGTLPGPASTRALIEALDSPHLPVHIGTVAIQSLNQLGDPAAREAVQRFRDRLAQAPAASGFQRELQDEATQAADRALAQLDH